VAVLCAVVLVAASAFLYLGREGPVVPSSEVKMLVVLPFENLGSQEDEYFADGLTEELTNRLSYLHGLGVISRTSAKQYKETPKTIKQIGEELGVDYVLEGTVRWNRIGGGESRVRVTPQLIRVSDDTHLWSERYDRVLEDIFSVQSEIAEEVIKQLDITVLGPERKALYEKPTANLEAYDYYLRAAEHWTLGYLNQDANENEKAIELLQKAVELDSSFTLAYLFLTHIHSHMYAVGIDRTEERLAKSRYALDRALALEPDLPEVQLALGSYYVRAFQDYDRALEIFKSVQRARPNIPPSFLGFIQTRQGKWEEAIANYEKAFKLHPRSSDLAHILGRRYAWIGKYEKSEEWFNRALSIYPDLYYSKLGKARLPMLSSGDTKQSRILIGALPHHILTDYNWFILGILERNFDEVLDRLASTPYDTFAEAHFYIPVDLAFASVYHAMKDLSSMNTHADLARIHLERALGERPEDTRLHATLGLAYAYLGRKNEAIREGIRAVDLYPVIQDAFEGPRYILNLARIYSVVGEYEKAIVQLEHLMSIPCGNNISVHFLRLDPQWDPLRKYPRFQRLFEEKSIDKPHPELK
ncbi:MAG: tetratricopeptide repeat protein, partial [Candidatus Aminicenantaceae bacterium]